MIEQLEVRGTRIVVRVSSPRVSMTEHTAPAGFPGPPLHVHPGFDEIFVVLKGMLSVRVDGEVSELGPGESAYAEGTTPHTFANTTDEPATFLVALAPGGFEDYFRAMAEGDDERIAAVSQRFGYRPAG